MTAAVEFKRAYDKSLERTETERTDGGGHSGKLVHSAFRN